jgi:hypothetical protein
MLGRRERRETLDTKVLKEPELPVPKGIKDLQARREIRAIKVLPAVPEQLVPRVRRGPREIKVLVAVQVPPVPRVQLDRRVSKVHSVQLA